MFAFITPISSEIHCSFTYMIVHVNMIAGRERIVNNITVNACEVLQYACQVLQYVDSVTIYLGTHLTLTP